MLQTLDYQASHPAASASAADGEIAAYADNTSATGTPSDVKLSYRNLMEGYTDLYLAASTPNTPGTGIADQADAASSAASSLTCFVAFSLSTIVLHRKHSKTRKVQRRLH